MYDSVLAAKYLLAIAGSKQVTLNITKVQKMLYIAYGYFLAHRHSSIFNEQPKAWPYGPVFPNTRIKVDYTKPLDLTDEAFATIRQDLELTNLFNRLVDKYAQFSSSQFSSWSYKPGSPWDLTTQQKGFDWDQAIPDAFIKNYFSHIDV